MCKARLISTFLLTDAANRINRVLSSNAGRIEKDELRLQLREVVAELKKRENEFDATDFSRLAWLHIRLGEYGEARAAANAGLEIDQSNEHCLNLLAKFPVH
jgi:hypothetical protein